MQIVYLFIGGAVCAIATLVALFSKRLTLAGWALLAATFFVGAVLAVPEERSLKMEGGATVVLTGVLDGPPEFARDRLYLVLRVEHGLVSLLAPFRNAASEQEFRALDLRYGGRIRVTATLSRTDNYRNPGVSPLSEYLDRKGYAATGTIKSAGAIVRLEDTRVFPPLAWLYSWRERLQREIDSRFDPETAGVLGAAVLGNRHNLTIEASERFREGGTFHVLVISGLHISFIGGIVLLAVRRLTNRRLIQFVLPATIVWGYSIAVGAEASVVRAALMFTFIGFGAVLFRPATSLNALGGAALVLLIHDPKELFDPSFQLTFLSVLAIVAIAWPLLRKFAAIGSWYPTSESPYPPNCSRGLKAFCETLFWSERHWKQELARSTHRYRMFKVPFAAVLERYHLQRGLRYVFGAVAVSIAVQIVLLPQMIVYFHRLSLSSWVLNIVVSVLLAVLAAVALVALILVQVSAPVAAPLFKLAQAIDWLMVHSVDPFAHIGIASLRLPEYSGWPWFIYVLYYVPLLLLIVALNRWQPLARSPVRARRVLPLTLAQATLIAILILHPFSASRADAGLRIDFLDVGQGDAALITMPDGTTLLVDGGGRPFERASRSIGEAVVSEYLWWRGLDRVDYVLATHADADHIAGLNDVVRNFEIGAALVGRAPANDPEFEAFSKSLGNTNLQIIQAGDVIRFGGVELKVLWPPPGTDSNNNDSVVLKLKLGARSILLTGDIEKKTEAALITSDLRSDVVKVAHHGSKTSSTSEFVSAARPRYAIVSVGKHSMFGHPHAEVVERWKAIGAEVITTGECGTITVTTDGTDLRITGMQSRTSSVSRGPFRR
ncbi:MAG TPA: DNA internalization-related competence protein ComEC/Rec2 [Pyrinomonadaceae bacterium]|nr:DNA internalization-related competence protein ComEC/Rec2 [Pyrinomonadaceae bacterium]